MKKTFGYTDFIMKYVGVLLMIWMMISCGSSSNKFKDSFNPAYQARDAGGLNASVTGSACSINSAKAEDSAKKAASYHLRSLLGNQRYKTEYEIVREYVEGEKRCFEIQARAKPI
ncbi:MAG: hypothetical protein VYB60_06890 [SAR324 cluster bacterium]|nr:hypothetical protein [SAR324 cluster bacterium]